MQSNNGGRFIFLLLLLQIVVNILHSVTAFPFLHYGMYSESFERKKTTVYEVWVNGKQLPPKDFPVLTWDMLHIPLASREKMTATHDFAFDKNAIESDMSKAGLANVFNVIKPNLDNAAISDSSFAAWYQSYLQRILHYPVNTLTIVKSEYICNDGNYVLLKREPWLQLN
jgi:hypothetical protein